MLDDRNRRLSECRGYRVFDPGGRIGVVADLVYDSREDRPDALVVRRGLFRRRTLTVPVEQVVEIDPEGRRVLVYGAPVGRVRFEPPAFEELEGAEAPLALVPEREAGPGGGSSGA